jgi:hypothetical protein
MIDIEDAIRDALRIDASRAPQTDDAFVPGSVVLTETTRPHSRRPYLVAAAAGLLVIGSVWAMSGRDPENQPASGQSTTPSSVHAAPSTAFHLVLDDPRFTMTLAQVGVHQVFSTYRNDEGSDDSSRAAVTITTVTPGNSTENGSASVQDEFPSPDGGFERSTVSVAGAAGTLYSKPGLAFIVIDLGDGRQSTIALEQLAPEVVDALIGEFRFVTESEFSSLATRSSIPLQTATAGTAIGG